MPSSTIRQNGGDIANRLEKEYVHDDIGIRRFYK
jgi:hypothetical protein